MSSEPRYPEVLQPFTWPAPGVRTWQPAEKALFCGCTTEEVCRACPVGVVATLDGGPYGCESPCHNARWAQLRGGRPAAKAEPRPARARSRSGIQGWLAPGFA